MVTNSRLVAILSTIYGKSGRRTDWHVKNSILWLVQNDVIDRALCGGNKHDSKFHQVEWECYVIRNISRIQFWKWRLKAQRTQFFHSGRKLWNSRTIMERLKRKKDLLWTNLRRPQSEWSQHARFSRDAISCLFEYVYLRFYVFKTAEFVFRPCMVLPTGLFWRIKRFFERS